jgi:hypothetical protein
MTHTFTGMVMSFPNRAIHFVLAETLKFRKQLTVRSEFTSQSGWNDSLNAYMMVELEAIAETVKRGTYSPSSPDPTQTKAARLAEAKDTSKTLKDAFDGKSINSDDIVMASGSLDKDVPYDLTGNDPDYPQPTPDLIPNDFARMFLVALDSFAVAATRLDSRTQPVTINAMESAQLLALLNELFAVCVLKGGEANRSETPTGLLPSQVPATFNADGSLDPANQAAK